MSFIKLHIAALSVPLEITTRWMKKLNNPYLKMKAESAIWKTQTESEESVPGAGFEGGALWAALDGAAFVGAAGLAGITALALSNMATTWSFEAG